MFVLIFILIFTVPLHGMNHAVNPEATRQKIFTYIKENNVSALVQLHSEMRQKEYYDENDHVVFASIKPLKKYAKTKLDIEIFKLIGHYADISAIFSIGCGIAFMLADCSENQTSFMCNELHTTNIVVNKYSTYACFAHICLDYIQYHLIINQLNKIAQLSDMHHRRV